MQHDGHRDRMRQKFITDGLDSFNPHEVLELLLFYAIPRRNTNDIAHRLMDTFGSLSAVFDASKESLCRVEGVGESAATLIKMIPQLSRRYMDDKYNTPATLMNSESVGDMLLKKYIGRNFETVYLVLADSKRKLLFCGIVSEGSVNASEIYVRKIVEYAIRYSASYAILAHNHPSGVALPSRDDLTTTAQVRDALALINVQLIDHLIIADNDYVSLAQSGIGDTLF